MQKFKKFLFFSFSVLLIINNIFLFTLANKYRNLDRIITPTISLSKNKLGNKEGITLNPGLIFNKRLKSKTQMNFKKFYLLSNAVIIFLMINKRKEPDYYGTAKFADKDEIERMGITKNPDDGVVLGMTPDNKIITHTGVEHLLNMAPTRTGKGINTVLPTLWTWKSSVIVNDIKGECWDLTSGYRRSVLNQNCIFYNPMDSSGEGISYNPLSLVKVGTLSEQEDARTIAITLLDTDGKGGSDHWITSAINLLTAVILHVKYANVNASFIDVMQFLEDPKEPLINKIGSVLAKKIDDYGDVVDLVEEDNEGNVIKTYDPFNHYEELNTQVKNNLTFYELYQKRETLHPVVGSTFGTIMATPDKERGSIFSTCINKLSIFKDPRVMRNIGRSDISPREIMDNRISLYLITPPKAIEMTKPLFRLIITQTIYELTDKMEFNNRKKIDKEKKKPLIDMKKIKSTIEDFIIVKIKKGVPKNKRILFLIDEFPALGKLGLFESALAYIAGYGLKVLLIVQSINQLNNIYGKDNSIVDNCSVQLYFTPNDKETPRMISDMMGNKTEKIITRSGRGFFMDSRNESYQARALMTPGEVRVLPYENILLLFSGKNPIKGNKIFWFKHKKFKDNADYNIPYASYLKLVKLFEDEGLTEYAVEYLIYLKKGYKVLKSIIDKLGQEKFVQDILKNKELNDEIDKFIKLEEKDKKNEKEIVLKSRLKSNRFKTKEEYEKVFQEYLNDFTDEDFIKCLRITYYSDKKNLEKTLEENLRRITEALEREEQLPIEILEHLKEKGVSDVQLPKFPKRFIIRLLELERENSDIVKKAVEVIENTLEKEQVISTEMDFVEIINMLNRQEEERKEEEELKKAVEENENQIETN